MDNIINDFIDNGFLDFYLVQNQKNFLKETVKNINKGKLYSSMIHGLHHSQKVLLFAYLIGLQENLNEVDMQIIIDASLYHDIGRTDDKTDSFHGLVGANKIDKVVTSNIYKDKENLNILKGIIDAHSQNNKLEVVAINYDVENIERFTKLATILKDADALDRTRFMKTSKATLKENLLKLDYSKTLISLAEEVNSYYRLKMCEINYQKLQNTVSEEEIECSHGIGFDFFRLDSILKNGILSNFAKINKDVKSSRRFFGNNGELWISLVNGRGEAYNEFVNNGISFDVKAKIRKGIKDKKQSIESYLPCDSSKYSDEVFAFYEIPKENILRINCSNLDVSVDKLKYLTGSGNPDAILSIVDNYIQNIRTYCNYFPDISKVYELIKTYNKIVSSFEQHDRYFQEQNLENHLRQSDMLIEGINSEIQRWMIEAFRIKFLKEKVIVRDVFEYILNLQELDYNLDGNTVTFKQRDRRIK